jgi:hypothetical protein
MDSFESLMQKLRQRAIADACTIDPTFKEKVEANRREIEEHEKTLEAQRAAAQQREEPKTEWHKLWEKMAKPKAS